jgi:hypothetical protein
MDCLLQLKQVLRVGKAMQITWQKLLFCFCCHAAEHHWQAACLRVTALLMQKLPYNKGWQEAGLLCKMPRH